MLVVDRVEAAQREEREVLAVEREHRVGVAEAALGDRHRLAVFEPHEDDLREARAHRVAVGEPGAVRGERDVVDLAVAAAGQLAELTVREQEQAPVVGGEGDALAVGRGHELQHAAELAEPLRLRRVGGARVERGDAHGVLAERVVDPHRAVLAQRRGEPGPHARGGLQRAGGAVAVGEPVHRAPDADDAGPAGRVRAHAAQPLARRDAVGLAGGAGAAEPDVEEPGFAVEVVEQPELPGRLVDHAGAVGGGVPGVERGRARRAVVRAVVGVAAQVRSPAVEGVEVAPALVVGEERDPVADQHRRVEVAVEVGGEPHERCRRGSTTACPRCRRGSASATPSRGSWWPRAARTGLRSAARDRPAGRAAAAGVCRRPPG